MNEPLPVILVVDDNEDNRYLLTRRLRRLGYETVLTANDGVEAIEMVSKQPVDLMLLDVLMPGMNGHQVLQQLKAYPASREIRVIMISAVDEIESVVRGMSAVAELKATNEVKPRRLEDVTVLFSDIVGFTRYCDCHPAEQVVSELRTLVDAFEDIVEAHAMEKIKTIGDAFLATAGLLHPMENGVLAAVRCAKAMIDTSQRLKPGWAVRIGIHSGPVVAGIMGRRQYSFDLWGDTVNTAARVTSHAEGGSILMSATAWARVRHCCMGRSRGLVELKGKGAVELFECHGLRYPETTVR